MLTIIKTLAGKSTAPSPRFTQSFSRVAVIALEVESSNTINNVKSKIHATIGIPRNQTSSKQLENSSTLSSNYNIHQEPAPHFFLCHRRGIQIFTKTFTGKGNSPLLSSH